jgi:hypothetical protein
VATQSGVVATHAGVVANSASAAADLTAGFPVLIAASYWRFHHLPYENLVEFAQHCR